MDRNAIRRAVTLLTVFVFLFSYATPVFAKKDAEEPVTSAPEETSAVSCEEGGHSVPSPIVVYPTQTDEGLVTGICEICGKNVVVQILPPEAGREESRLMGDTDGDGAILATDARAILRSVSLLEPLPPEGLAYSDMNADCLLTAADARLALRTGASLEEPVRHSFTVDITLAPTCTGEGVLTCRCDYCSEEETLAIPANGHSFTEETDLAPTCTEPGHASAVCGVCGAKKDITLPAAGHSFGEPVTAEATCTADGSIVRTCTVCGFREETVLKATGHSWQEATLETPARCALCGEMKTGWTNVGGSWVLFLDDGSRPSGQNIVNASFDGTDAPRYIYNGVWDPAFRGAVSCSGADWTVAQGIASQVVTEADRTLFRAFGEVAKATTPDMTMEQKLRACFDYSMTAYLESRPRTPHYTGIDWPIIYANDMFVNGTGNCCSYAAAFAFLAKAIGYENVYACNSGGHGWAEIDGLIYDPEWCKGNHYYSYYGLSYDTQTDVRYKQAISAMEPWMHVKI